jgi:hypothetical protein
MNAFGQLPALQAISRCQLCDLQGYRPNGLLCDHVDHRPAYDRGMAAVREVLAKSKRESVRPTLLARQEAFNRQQLVNQARESGPPLPLDAE